MTNIVNNLKLLLYIFQLEGYDETRFRNWLMDHQNEKINEEKSKIRWTVKAYLLYYLALLINQDYFNKHPAGSLITANRIISLPERIVKQLIILKATIKIRQRKNLIVIGVTGSYGKTSVKEILAHILSIKYKVLKTPDSYNTPLGISKIINQELKPEHQVFVVEMGAHQKGDIKALCDLVKPQMGIITSIGKQHLERFGSEEKIEETKFELIDSLPANGKAFLNINDPKILERSKKYPKDKIIYFGICNDCVACKTNGLSNCNTALKVTGIQTTANGTVFSIITEDNEVRKITTPLLGKHNVRNIMAAVNVSRYLDILYKDIERQCLTLEPIPHRLHLIKGVNDTTIIDDAFNANPDSARAALEVLADFPSTRKIIITPGLVELGNKQEEENRILGEEMGGVADYVIVVGDTNREAIVDGLESRIPSTSLRASMNHESRVETQNIASLHNKTIYFCVKNLNEATEKLQEFVIPGSVILFENDLPDQYK